MMRLPALHLIWICTAAAQPSAVLDSLEQRALSALSNITPSDATNARIAIRATLSEALCLHCTLPLPSNPFLVYLPPSPVAPLPAVICIRPHMDPTTSEARVVPSALAGLGLVVVEVDGHTYESNPGILKTGVTSQALIQRDIRTALRYLASRNDVDRTRIGLLGEGLAGTIAAALNPEISVAAIINGAPDFTRYVNDARAFKTRSDVDPCMLVPGLLTFASTNNMLSLIAPRPLLLVNAADAPAEYAKALYGPSPQLRVQELENNASPQRNEVYSWFARFLLGHNISAPIELPGATEPQLVNFAPAAAVSDTQNSPPPISEPSLEKLLGPPLPEGNYHLAADCRGDHHRIDFNPQQGIRIGVTLLRPGPDACGYPSGVLIALDDQGRSTLPNDEVVREGNRNGFVVWMLDPRGIGEMDTHASGYEFAMSVLLGEDVAWRRAIDVIRVIRQVGGHSKYPTVLYARGANSGLTASYVAAVLDKTELQTVILRDAASSFQELHEFPYLRPPFAGRTLFDIADLWRAARPRLMVNPTDSALADFAWQ